MRATLAALLLLALLGGCAGPAGDSIAAEDPEPTPVIPSAQATTPTMTRPPHAPPPSPADQFPDPPTRPTPVVPGPPDQCPFAETQDLAVYSVLERVENKTLPPMVDVTVHLYKWVDGDGGSRKVEWVGNAPVDPKDDASGCTAFALHEPGTYQVRGGSRQQDCDAWFSSQLDFVFEGDPIEVHQTLHWSYVCQGV